MSNQFDIGFLCPDCGLEYWRCISNANCMAPYYTDHPAQPNPTSVEPSWLSTVSTHLNSPRHSSLQHGPSVQTECFLAQCPPEQVPFNHVWTPEQYNVGPINGSHNSSQRILAPKPEGYIPQGLLTRTYSEPSTVPERAKLSCRMGACNILFTCRRNRNRHEENVCGKNGKIDCKEPKCNGKFSRYDNLLKHTRNVHKKCLACNQVFKDSNAVEDHMIDVHNTKPNACRTVASF